MVMVVILIITIAILLVALIIAITILLVALAGGSGGSGTALSGMLASCNSREIRGWIGAYSSHGFGLGDSYSNGAAVSRASTASTTTASSDGDGRDLNEGDCFGSSRMESGGLLSIANLVVAVGTGGLSLVRQVSFHIGISGVIGELLTAVTVCTSVVVRWIVVVKTRVEVPEPTV